MRIRNIKPEFWNSEDIAELTWPTRLIFVGLWSYVDDNGVGRDIEKIITSSLFPLEDDVHATRMQIATSLRELHTAGLIHRYRVGSRSFVEIAGWSKHQYVPRPNKSRYPHVTCADAVILTPDLQPVADDMQFAADSLRVSEGQGVRGTEENPSSDADASDQESTDPEVFSDDVEKLCEYLAEKIRANGNKVPTIGTRWKQAADRLMRIDGYTPNQIRQVIDWSQRDEFWQGNILSMNKLREKFDTLKTRMLNERGKQTLSAVAGRSTGEQRIAELQALKGQLPENVRQLRPESPAISLPELELPR